MIYFDSDMSKSINTVVYFDGKKVIYIYVRVSFVCLSNKTKYNKF
jgi:hypothetical protein